MDFDYSLLIPEYFIIIWAILETGAVDDAKHGRGGNVCQGRERRK